MANYSPTQQLQPGLVVITILSLILAVISTPRASNAAPAQLTSNPTNRTYTQDLASLMATVQQTGSVHVIAALNMPFDNASRKAVQLAQPEVRQTRAALLAHLKAYNVTVNRGDWLFPGIALTVDAAALQHLESSPLVSSIVPDRILKMADAASDALIGAPVAWNENFQGQNEMVAILDSGVFESHPFFQNRVSLEACFSHNDPATHYTSNCPNGQPTQYGAGAGVNCNISISSCEHGTHVAGIAAGNGAYNGGPGYSGVAIQSGIAAVQVFSTFNDGIHAPGEGAYDSDVISGLNFIYSQAGSYPFAAVNLSLAAPQSDFSPSQSGPGSACDTFNPTETSAIQSLRAINIATVIAAGNDGYHDGISYPGCISFAISVGATGDGSGAGGSGDPNNIDQIAYFSNNAPNLDLFAPGVNIYSSVPYGYNPSGFASLDGTSMATPQVTGAIAILKSERPGATVAQLLSVLQNTGKPILDSAGNASIPRIQIDAGISAFVPRHKTIGVYRGNTFYLRNSNTAGYADETIPFGYGSIAFPVVGDWSGSGIDRIGVFDQSNGLFTLCYQAANTSCSGTAGFIQLVLGNANDQPLSGRWLARDKYNGGAIIGYPFDGVGVFRPSNGLIYLKNTLSTGVADETMVLGIPGDTGIAGDWNGDGMESPGVYRPSNSTYYLSNQVCNCAVYADVTFTYGLPNNLPVAGNWLGSPTVQNVGIGLLRPSDGYFYLRNTLATGYADIAFTYGLAGDKPVSGHWTNTYTEPPPTVLMPNLPQLSGSSSPGTTADSGIGD